MGRSGRGKGHIAPPERLIFHFRQEISMLPRLLNKNYFLQGQFQKKQHFPAFCSFLPAGGNVERKEMLEKLAGLSSMFTPAQAVFHIYFLSTFPPLAQPGHFAHFFPFLVSTLNQPKPFSTFLSFRFPPFWGGGGLPLEMWKRKKGWTMFWAVSEFMAETWQGKKGWKMGWGCLLVDGGNMENKERWKVGWAVSVLMAESQKGKKGWKMGWAVSQLVRKHGKERKVGK